MSPKTSNDHVDAKPNAKPFRPEGPTGSTSAEAPATDECTFDAAVDLARVDPAAILDLAPEQVLRVTLVGDAPNEGVVCVRADTGAVVGAVVGLPGLGRLVRCVRKGVVYAAVVLARGKGSCRVRISGGAGAPAP